MMPRDALLRDLRDALAGLYLHEADQDRLVKDALLDPRLIPSSPRPIDRWRLIVEAADQAGRLAELLDIAAGQNPAIVPLSAGRDAYGAWQVAGRPLTPREQQLDRLRAGYGLRASWNGDMPLPLTQVGRLEEVLRHHKVFGGRPSAMNRLDAFVAGQPGGYLLVTGPAGIGKSALLAEWIRRLQAGGQAVCFTFVNRAEDLAGAAFTFQNLCEQLAHAHGLSGSLPGSELTLRSLYPELLQLPPGDHQKLAVVLDGLDEALAWQPRADLFPPEPPNGLYVVFSAREMPGVDWLAQLELPGWPQSRLDLAAMDVDDISSLLENSGGRAAALAGVSGFAEKVRTVSRGDPFYLHFLVQDILDGAVTEENIGDQPPDGLDGYLEQWWNELAQEVDNMGEVSDLLGILSVAKGRLLPEELKGISDSLKKGPLLKKSLAGKLRRYLTGDELTGYAVAHPRFGFYLSHKVFDADQTRDYLEQLLTYCADWETNHSRYALAHYAEHLAEGVDRSPAGDLTAAIRPLVELTGSRAFQEVHASVLSDLPALQADLERALDAASQGGSPDVAVLAIESGLALVDWRARELRPEPLFERARRGAVADARHRLDLFDIDPDWRQAIRLSIAWLAFTGEQATDQSRGAARALLNEVQPQRPMGDPLGRLWDWVVAAVEDIPPPKPDLPLAPPLERIQFILDRMSGSGNVEMLNRRKELLGDEALGFQPGQPGQFGFLSAQDGPYLVAYASEHGQEGDVYLDRYIDIHTGYGYPQYRHRSLWLLLDAVVRHPKPAWVRDTVEKLATAALAGSQYDFREGLSISVSAALAREGGDASEFQAARQQAYDDAAPLLDWDSGLLDLTGSHRRRLAAYAEALHCLVAAQDTADLLWRALNLNYGFAGYGMPAYLALAEAVRICRPEDAGLIADALDRATTSAHNVNEETYAAQSTARCNAMREMWWPAGGIPDLAGAAARLREDPGAPEFAALHHVGDQYQGREPDYRLPLSKARTACSLQQLADLFKQPVGEFQRLNRDHGWAPDQPLDDGTAVLVPDPELAPLLAARFAAEALAQASLAPAARRELIQSLLPVAAANATALDTVLARLVLADPPPGKDLEDIVERFQPYLTGARQAAPPPPGIGG